MNTEHLAILSFRDIKGFVTELALTIIDNNTAKSVDNYHTKVLKHSKSNKTSKSSEQGVTYLTAIKEVRRLCKEYNVENIYTTNQSHSTILQNSYKRENKDVIGNIYKKFFNSITYIAKDLYYLYSIYNYKFSVIDEFKLEYFDNCFESSNSSNLNDLSLQDYNVCIADILYYIVNRCKTSILFKQEYRTNETPSVTELISLSKRIQRKHADIKNFQNSYISILNGNGARKYTIIYQDYIDNSITFAIMDRVSNILYAETMPIKNCSMHSEVFRRMYNKCHKAKSSPIIAVTDIDLPSGALLNVKVLYAMSNIVYAKDWLASNFPESKITCIEDAIKLIKKYIKKYNKDNPDSPCGNVAKLIMEGSN